jgi:PAS domain S-box-containing protein
MVHASQKFLLVQSHVSQPSSGVVMPPGVRGPSAAEAEIVNVLVVDDRTADLTALRAVLELPGYAVMTASSGGEAFRLLFEHDFAVILLDVNMPGMDGFELATAIKQRERSRLTPIVFLTAEGVDLKRLYRAYSVGAIDYLQKPVDSDVVRAKVAVFADLYRKELLLRRQAITLQEAERRERALERAELQLAAERRYRNLAESIPEIVWTATPDGQLDYCNRRWREYTGLPFEATSGHGFLKAIHVGDASEARRRWLDAVAQSAPFTAECRLRRADGEYRYHVCHAVPECDAGGRVLAWLGTFVDFHDLKRAISARDEFMAMASHELRTPLTALKLRLQSLQRNAPSGEALQTKLDGAMRQTGRLERLIDNLLDMSRITSGVLEIHPERFELVATIREVSERFATDAERAGVAIKLALPPSVEVVWDRLRIEQALSNLLSNAFHYREHGPVRVTVEANASEAKIGVEGGSSIPPAELPRIFESFRQPARLRSHGGLGVGLFLTRQIATAHGGSLVVTSPGEALPVFTLLLPLFSEPHAPQDGGRAEEESGGVA